MNAAGVVNTGSITRKRRVLNSALSAAKESGSLSFSVGAPVSMKMYEPPKKPMSETAFCNVERKREAFTNSSNFLAFSGSSPLNSIHLRSISPVRVNTMRRIIAS